MSDASTIATGSGSGTDEPAASAASARAFRDRTGRDMFLALACLLVPILLVGALLRACGSAEPTVVDADAVIADARTADRFPVLAPEGLGDAWRPVQATFRRTDEGTVGTLRLGYLTPSGGQVLLVESNEDAARVLARELGEDVRPDGEVVIAGRSWTRSVVRGTERALVHIEDERVVIIVGRVTVEELTELAGTLR